MKNNIKYFINVYINLSLYIKDFGVCGNGEEMGVEN